MAALVNRTPHAVAATYGRDIDGKPALFVSVKATFTWDRSINTLERVLEEAVARGHRSMT